MDKKKKIQLVIGIAAVFLCGVVYLSLGPVKAGTDKENTEFVAGGAQTGSPPEAAAQTSETASVPGVVSGATVYVYITGDKVVIKDMPGKEVSEEAVVDDGRVDINTAGEEELKQIPGIGDAKASAIVSYRSEHGRFKKIEDLMQISGIKEGIFNRIKDHIRV